MKGISKGIVLTAIVGVAACGGDDDGELDVGSSSGATSSGTSGLSSGFPSSSSGEVGSSSGEGGSSSGEGGSGSSSGGEVVRYSVGGELSQLTGASLTLRNNGGDSLVLIDDGPFTFATQLLDGRDYAVTVGVQPEGNRCTIERGEGTIDGANVTDVEVTCEPSFTVGGTASGLKGSLVLESGGEQVTVDAEGAFVMPLALVEGETYSISIVQQPAGQDCVIDEHEGTVTGEHIDDVVITCRDLDVVINEIYNRPGAGHWGDSNGDGVRDANHDEFIEIMNNESMPVQLDGFTLRIGRVLNNMNQAAELAVRFTFPAGSELPAGGRAVVFGGGTPTGSFGSALVLVSAMSFSMVDTTPNTTPPAGSELPNLPNPAVVRLDASAALVLDTVQYTSAATVAEGNCSNNCRSRTRDPEGTGEFKFHDDVQADVLSSPGVAAAAAIPKLAPSFSAPMQGAAAVGIYIAPLAQFNMALAANASDGVALFRSGCDNPQNLVGVVPALVGNSAVRLTPDAPLEFGTTYCLRATDAVLGVNGVALDLISPSTVQFSTRDATSFTAGTVVISQVGGASFSGANGHQEFVELYNPTDQPIDVAGWHLQRRTAGGTASCFATLPEGTSIAAHRYLLIGGANYNSPTPAAVPPDVVAHHINANPTPGTSIGGSNESLLLLSGDNCATPTPAIANRVDAVSYGNITDSYAGLYLPALPGGTISAVRRKACFDSTATADPATGMAAGGGHAASGSGERLGDSSSDWVRLAAPAPRNKDTAAQVSVCD